MIDFQAAKELGLTNQRLREYFQSKQGDECYDKKERLLDVASSRINERIDASWEDYHIYSAIDLAWDSSPVNKYTIPLMLYAQGRVSVDIATDLEKRPETSKYVQRTEHGKQINLPKFFETNVNLLRSVITRRLAAQSAKYNSLYPFFKFHPRVQTQKGRFLAEALSERVDIIADQYGYRHTQMQEMRNMLLYGHQFSFPSCSWEKDCYIYKSPQTGLRTSRIYREGINWILPHPTRTFYDTSHAASSLNTDSGCEYVGYWDVMRWGDIKNNPDFWNTDDVGFNGYQLDWFSNNKLYWNQYMDVVKMPTVNVNSLTETNDRLVRIGDYAASQDDASVVVTEYFVKVKPNQWGISDYSEPVWLRLKIAGDRTVIYAEIMPSSPCAVFSYNEHDNRLVNLSLGHEILPYQDQLTNLFTQLLETIKKDMFTVGVLNEDAFPRTEEGQKVKESFRKLLEGKDYDGTTHVLMGSFEELAESGVNVNNVFTFVRTSPNHTIDNIFKAINRLLDMADRLMALSPQELGQVSPRETTATEVAAIATTTESVYGLISDCIDEARAAKKRIVYESLVSKGSDTVDVAVKAAYPEEMIQSMGFDVVVQDEASGLPQQESKLHIRGAVEALIHDYSFSSRDGAERVNNPQTAMTLIQLFQNIVTQPMILQSLGKEKLFEIINTIFRLAGTGVHTSLQLKPGEDDNFVDQSATTEAINEIAGVIQEMDSRMTGLENLLQQQSPIPQNEAIIGSDSELARKVANQQF